ncbi:hypothetical protein AB0395_21890 [Streptosporangium sp. NPDC051023]|uniref:hypothetical protein n=1 Tax=Streptosporangium sp. NPDC051023 TaxID=3155410 RepID=UPI00344B559D
MAKSFCPRCGLVTLGDITDDYVCACGIRWLDLAPFPRPHLDRAEWDWITTLLLTRSGGLCEARTSACMARRGLLSSLPRSRCSIHHRQPRGMGGTSSPVIHSLANLLLICGSGVTGCHGQIESCRAWAEERGLLVEEELDPAQAPLTLHSGRVVLLHPTVPTYLNPAAGPRWAA